MNTVLNYLLLGMALVIGGLVIALKMQRSKLHKAQIDLLRFTIDTSMGEDDRAIARAKELLLRALRQYNEGYDD